MIYCYALRGFEGDLVKIEVELRRALPGIDMVGLPDSAIRESKERVRAAIKTSGYEFPKERVLINLAPAGIPKAGASYDLAIALALLWKSEQWNMGKKSVLVMGELQLGGEVRPVSGILSAMIGAQKRGIENFIIPKENLKEALSLNYGSCYPIEHLSQLDNLQAETCIADNRSMDQRSSFPDFSEIKGQNILKRALTVAAAGRHHTLLFGPPGCGKTFSARALQGILPPMDREQSLTVTRLWSQAGKMQSGIVEHPPFREPHHSASSQGILGGTSHIIPGEISLAHGGLLLLDEAPEFSNRVLQGLREPLETGRISLVRAGKSYWFPADFQLIMTANPCPCGNLGRRKNPCICSGREIDRYWKSLTGPLLDRVDIRIPLEPVDPILLMEESRDFSSHLAGEVKRVRRIQQKRFNRWEQPWNSTMKPSEINKFCALDAPCQRIFRQAVDKLGLSSRACHSLLKVARTIADLERSVSIHQEHLLEAIAYRRYGEGDLFWRKNTR